jgi:Ca2+-binding EF-hand superfamily protein
VQARLCAALCVVLDKREVLKCGGRVSLLHSTFNSNFSLQELEAFINDQACHPNGVLDFPEFLNVLSRLICDSLDVAVMPVMPVMPTTP